MTLDELKEKIKSGKYPRRYRHFGGANLIITDDPNRNYHDGDIVVCCEHAGSLSWLVEQLKQVYFSELDYANKYIFYPRIGIHMQQALNSNSSLPDAMLKVIDEIQREWYKK
jgi:hypothetical protein